MLPNPWQTGTILDTVPGMCVPVWRERQRDQAEGPRAVAAGPLRGQLRALPRAFPGPFLVPAAAAEG